MAEARLHRLGRTGPTYLLAAAMLAAMFVGRVPVLASPLAKDSAAWEVQPTPNGSVAAGNQQSVSCVTSTSCVAVGGASGLSWNGSAWSLETLPAPKGEGFVKSTLTSVSCTQQVSCMAVGYYSDFNVPTSPFADLWSGGRWTLETMPAVAGSDQIIINSVSCASSASCVAVGFWYNSQTSEPDPLAELWNGTVWSQIQTSYPSGTSSGQLEAVSCVASAICMAVGSATSGYLVGEVWDSRGWTPAPMPHVPDARLTSVSCTSSAACTAVGQIVKAGPPLALALLWRTGKWALQALPSPHGAPTTELSGVSCTSTTSCSAIGYYDTASSSIDVPFSESWNGAVWSLAFVPIVKGALDTFMYGITCTTAAQCLAVGYTILPGATRTLTEQWSGKNWVIQTTPNPLSPLPTTLNAVACTSASSCDAVGDYESPASPADQISLGEQWNGSRWAAELAADGLVSADLVGLSCTGSACMAVGSFDPTSTTRDALAESWNGSKWSIVTAVAPTNVAAELTAVSCTTASSCMAVGRYENTAGNWVALAEQWDGKSWTTVPVPVPSGATEYWFASVDCLSTTWCMAVGVAYNIHSGTTPIAILWNGSKWTIGRLKSSPSAPLTALQAVDCSSEVSCDAVGDTTNSSDQTQPIAYGWNGSAWTRPPMGPAPDGSLLNSLACTGPSVCVAVGSIYSASHNSNAIFSMTWAGSVWVRDTLPAMAQRGYLTSVSCSGARCTAVGSSNGYALAISRT